MIRLSCWLTVVVASCAVLSADAAEPQWIWNTKDAATRASAGQCFFRKSFKLEGPQSGEIEITCDNAFDLYVNGRAVGSGNNFKERTRFNIGGLLAPGENLIAVSATNAGEDPAGLMVKATIRTWGKPVEIVSDASWLCGTTGSGRWFRPDFNPKGWKSAFALGAYGKTAPWGAAGQVVEAKLSIPAGERSHEKGLFELRDGDRVVLLGGTFIERLQNDGYLETALTAALPHKNITYRNLGWSGDTVWGDSRAVFGNRADGFKRLVSDVQLCQPTVLIICYGQNEAFAGEPGLPAFRDGLNDLLDALEPTGARILLVGPPPRFDMGPPLPDPTKYNQDLQKYTDVIQAAAGSRGHSFFDLAPEFDRLVEAARRQGAESVVGQAITDNGTHFNFAGNRFVGEILREKVLGIALPRISIDIDLKSGALNATGTTVTTLKIADDRISFVAFDRCPTEESYDTVLQGSGLRLRHAEKGAYELLINGQLARLVPHEDAEHTWDFYNGAAIKQSLKLRQVINEKNKLFFHRYRPQNETYLFLFRKHEQGNNAVEIPMFDPLIAEKEAEIAKLRQPVPQKFEVIRVKE
jgi:lysophospholipase L1-like esterase